MDLDKIGRSVGSGAMTWAPRIFISLMFIPVCFGVFLLLGFEAQSAVRWAFGLYAAGFVLAAALFSTLGYLNSPFRVIRDPELKERLTRLEEIVEKTSPESLDPKTLKEIVTGIVRDMQKPTELVAPPLTSERRHDEWLDVFAGFEVTKNRLASAMHELTRRTNLNLALGTMITIAAGIALLLIVVRSPAHLDAANVSAHPWIVVAHYVPRLSVIVFAEVFAYFFLRLYKASLPEAKYYQNEMTNVEMRLVALKGALLMEHKESLAAVIVGLSKVERNVPAQPTNNQMKAEIDEWYALAKLAELLKTKVS